MDDPFMFNVHGLKITCKNLTCYYNRRGGTLHIEVQPHQSKISELKSLVTRVTDSFLFNRLWNVTIFSIILRQRIGAIPLTQFCPFVYRIVEIAFTKLTPGRPGTIYGYKEKINHIKFHCTVITQSCKRPSKLFLALKWSSKTSNYVTLQ